GCEDVGKKRQVDGDVVGPGAEGQRGPGDDIEDEGPPGETPPSESPAVRQYDEGRDHAQGQERREGMQEREEQQEDDRERPLPRILAFAEQEHRDGEHEEADRFLRGSARQEEEAAEEREKKTCDKAAETTAGHLHSEQVRDEDGGASEERQDQLDMDQWREACPPRCGGQQ